MPHSDSVTNGNCIEFKWDTACLADGLFDNLGNLIKVDVARHNLAKTICYADKGLIYIGFLQAAGIKQTPVRGTLKTFFNGIASHKRFLPKTGNLILLQNFIELLLINKGKSVVFRQQDAIITFEKAFTLRRKKMSLTRFLYRLSVAIAIVAVILMAGYLLLVPKEKKEKGAVLALKFNKGDTSIYKVIMETERTADFAGEITKDEQFISGKSGTRAEMIFIQQIENVDANGNATAKITIKSLKYIAITKDVQLLDFDSSIQGQQANALNKLIGQSYTIIITPTSDVIGAAGQDEIKSLVEGNAMENKAAVQLVSKNLIQRRHQIPALMDAGSKILKLGENWSSTRTVSFGAMGTNSFEKICTLKAIEEKEGKRTAVVEISGIPATIQKDATNPVAKLFDSTNNYTGTLLLDLNNGKIERYTEKLEAEWVVADPQATGGEPSTIKLGTKELNSLEKIE